MNSTETGSFAYRERALSFRDIAGHKGRHPSIVLLIWSRWDTEGHTKRHAGFQCPPIPNVRENRQIFRSAFQNRITT